MAFDPEEDLRRAFKHSEKQAKKEAFEEVLAEVVRERMNSTPMSHIISWLQARIAELEEAKDGS